VFPVRYGLNLYILFRRNSVFKGLKMDLKYIRYDGENQFHLTWDRDPW
jgi:hypothetical protein